MAKKRRSSARGAGTAQELYLDISEAIENRISVAEYNGNTGDYRYWDAYQDGLAEALAHVGKIAAKRRYQEKE